MNRLLLTIVAMLVVPGVAFAQAAWPTDAVPLATVQAKMAETRASLYGCYKEHVPESSREHGDVLKIRVIASESGRVFRVDFLESSYKSEEFESCARKILTSVDFGVKAAKTKFVQTIGLQNGMSNMTFSTPTPAGGAITKESVTEMALLHKDSIKSCYENALKGDGPGPGLQGQVLVELVVDGRSGMVQSARVVKSTLGHSATEQCLLGKVRTFRFPIPDDPGLVIIQYPFTFQSQK